MLRLSRWILCVALLGPSPAWAMRTVDFIDEQRGPVIVPGEQRTPVITLEPTLKMPDPAEAAQLPTREQAQVVTVPQVASPVPEASGVLMLGMGLLLLLLKPYKRDGEAIAHDPERYSTL